MLPKKHLLFIASLSSVFTLYNLYIINTSKPIGYALNIYNQIPSIFWYNLIIVYFLGCILVLQKKSIYRKIGVVVLLINYILMYLVPYSLGYFVYGTSDELSHVGEFNSIISTGYIDKHNTYPFIHIFYSSTSLISLISTNTLSFLLPCFFSLFFILSILLFSKKVLYFNEEKIWIVFLASLIYYFGHFHFSNVPNYAYFTVVPLILYLIAKNMDTKTFPVSIMLIIFVLSIPLSHPFIYLFIAYLLSITTLLKIKSKNNMKFIFILLMCSFAVWFINSFYLNSFSVIYNSFINSRTDSVAVKGLSLMSKIDLEGFELLKFIYFFGGRLIIPLFIIFSFIFFLYIKNITYFKKKDTVNTLFIMLLVFGLYQLFLVINPFISHGPDRIVNLNYSIFAMIPLFSLSILTLMKYDSKLLSAIRVSLVLTLIFTSSVFGAFYSPYIYQPNIGTTYNQVDGMQWLFNYKGEMPVYDLLGEIGHRYSDLFYGWSNTQKRYGKDIYWTSAGKIQDRFGYDENINFSTVHSYIVLISQQELMYQTVYNSTGRYLKSDFETFKNDSSVNKLYDSLDIEIYQA